MKPKFRITIADHRKSIVISRGKRPPFKKLVNDVIKLLTAYGYNEGDVEDYFGRNDKLIQMLEGENARLQNELKRRDARIFNISDGEDVNGDKDDEW